MTIQERIKVFSKAVAALAVYFAFVGVALF